MDGDAVEMEIPLQSSAVDGAEVASLPSSPRAAQADGTVELPYVAPSCSLAIQAKRALLVRNALVASNVTACSIASLTSVVRENACEFGKQVDLDDFMEMLRLLPEIRGRDAFQPLESTLARMYRSFQAAEKLDLMQLGTGALVLVGGKPRDKVLAAIQLLVDVANQEDATEKASKTNLMAALQCLLLAVSALFDEEDAEEQDVRGTVSILAQSVQETVERMWTANELQSDDDISVDSAWDWIEERLGKSLAWVKLLDHSKWPVTQRLTSSPMKRRQDSGSDRACESEPPLSEAPTAGDGPPELSFRFSGVDGGLLTIGEHEADLLFDLLIQSAFTKVHAQTMYDTFVQHTGDGLLEEETFLEAIEELVTMTNATQQMQDSEFLDTMLMIFRCFLPENCAKVDAFEIAAGFSLFAWGSKSDKLASSFHYFDVDSKGFLNRQQLWRFLRSILITLLYLSPPEENVVKRYGSIAELVDTGEQELMDSIMDGLEEDNAEAADTRNSDTRTRIFTFEEFGEWYNGGGFQGISWLELLDLRKWHFVSSHFHLDELDVVPVDPVVASTNYFTAQNIQVDVDAGNSTGPGDGHELAFPHAIEEEEDEDGDEEQVGNGAFPHSHSSFSSASTGPSHPATVNSSMPAILLKNEIVLEFDLAFDSEDDSTVEIPLSTLSFDNGDLIQYFELQRVVKLHEIELFQLFDVFEPYMEGASTAWMEKSTYDDCIKQLLPSEIALEVVSSFGVNSNTRVPPPSIGRSNDYKMIADTLSRLFFAFNRGGTGKIDLVEFVSAFTLFCAGSKSEKLAFAFRLFDADRDGALTRREMWKYLRSFLTMLLALGNGSELSAEAIASVADATAIAIADAIFKDTNKTFSIRHARSVAHQSHRFSIDTPESADTVVASRNEQLRRGQYHHRGSLPNVNTVSVEGGGVSTAGPGAGSAFVRGGVVSFEEFAQWYGTNGYNIIAWIELLDAKKWPPVNDSVAEAVLRYISRQHRAIAEAAMRGSVGGPDSGSTFGTDSSNGSHEGRSSSLEAEYSPGEMTPLNTSELRTANGDTGRHNSTMPSMADLITSPLSGASSSRDLSSVALQFKLTSFDNMSLRIRLKDVAVVYTIAERMGFRAQACEALLNRFNQVASGRCLTKSGFLRSMRDLVPRETLSNEDQEFLSFHLLRIFALFEAESVLEEDEDGKVDEANEEVSASPKDGDIQRTSSVEKLQVVAGMSIFCDGSKSSKLGVLFKLFDTHGDGYVSRRHMFEMLKSILVVLFAFSSFNANKAHANDTSINTWNTNSAAERAAGAVISKLFCEATCRHPDAISLAEFATWYANGGYIDCPWLELLDLTKWPAKEAFEASKKEKPLIYAFDMLEEGNLLHFTESDIGAYLFMLRSTKLNEVNGSKLYDALLAYATPSAEEVLKMSKANENPNGVHSYSYAAVEEDEGAYLILSRSNFYECIRSLVPKEDMSEKAQQTSSKLLSRLFNVFDRRRIGRVNALELACGLSILGKGSKSQKLSMAFEFITKMRQQRHRSLSNYGVASMAGFNAGAAVGGGVNITSTGGAFGWVTSGRGALATSTGLRRSTLQNETNALPHSVLFIYLRSFLLALMALSEGTYRLGLEKMYAEADDFIEEAMGDLMAEVAANGNNAIGGGGYAGYGTARSRARVTFEQFGEWYNSGGFEIVSWVELLDVDKWEQKQDTEEQTSKTSGVFKSGRVGSQRRAASNRLVEPVQTTTKIRTTQKKQIRQSDIVSATIQSVRSRGRKPAQPLSTHHEPAAGISLSSEGPIMVFAISEQAAELQFFNDDLIRLKNFLRETRLHEQTPRHVSRAVLSALNATGETGFLEVCRNDFVTVVEKVCSQWVGSPGGDLGDEALDLIDSILDVFVKSPPDSTTRFGNGGEDEDDISNDPLDAGLAICGLFAICGGSLLDKLKVAARLFDESLNDHCVDTTMDTLRTCLTCMLIAFYGMSCSLSGEVVRYSAQLGADEVLRDFAGLTNSDDEAMSPSTHQQPPPSLDLDEQVSLKDFTDWFSDSGYHSHPWLELTELQHWPAAIDICGSLNGAGS